MLDIAAAVNSSSALTGVEATVVASGRSDGIKLAGTDFGRASFASVRVINDGGLSRNATGLYNLAARDFNSVDRTRVSGFASGEARLGYTDAGQDVRGSINGHPAVGDGRTLGVDSPDLALRITLSAGRALGTANSQSLGSLLAFRLERP
jgi:hypothetical protein